jgi:hypothetical protein
MEASAAAATASVDAADKAADDMESRFAAYDAKYPEENPEKIRALARVWVGVRKSDAASKSFYGVLAKKARDARVALCEAEGVALGVYATLGGDAESAEKWELASAALDKARADANAAEVASDKARDDMCAAIEEALASITALEAFNPTPEEWKAILILRPERVQTAARDENVAVLDERDAASWAEYRAPGALHNTDDATQALESMTPADRS